MKRKKESQRGPAAVTLKRLRQEAGYSSREMAKAVGADPPSGYQYYEDRYKKDHLPPELYEKVKVALMARGIRPEQINDLLPQSIRSELSEINSKLSEIKSLLLENRSGDSAPQSGSSPDQPKPPIKH